MCYLATEPECNLCLPGPTVSALYAVQEQQIHKSLEYATLLALSSIFGYCKVYPSLCSSCPFLKNYKEYLGELSLKHNPLRLFLLILHFTFPCWLPLVYTLAIVAVPSWFWQGEKRVMPVRALHSSRRGTAVGSPEGKASWVSTKGQ